MFQKWTSIFSGILVDGPLTCNTSALGRFGMGCLTESPNQKAIAKQKNEKHMFPGLVETKSLVETVICQSLVI